MQNLSTFEFETSIMSIDQYFVNASEVAIPSCMNELISFLYTPERKERPAGRPISLAIACSFSWSLLTLRRGIFVPLDRKFHVPKDHQHHYQRSHRRVALASIISVHRLIRARQWLLWKVGLFLARYLRTVSRTPLLAIAAQRGNPSFHEVHCLTPSSTYETNVLSIIAMRIHRRRNN